MKKFLIFSILFVGFSVVSANWDANLQLFQTIRDGKFEELAHSVRNIYNKLQEEIPDGPGIIEVICSFFPPESRDIELQQLLPEIFTQPNPNVPCIVQSIEVVRQFCFNETWPILMVDAWAKIQSGFLSGNIRNPGHFTQCLKIKNYLTNPEAGGYVEGKHCSLMIGRYIEGSFDRSIIPDFLQSIFPNEPLVDIGGLIPDDLPAEPFLELGICVPRVCSNDVVLGVTRIITFLLGLGPNTFTANNLNQFCHIKETPPLGAMEWGAISLIILGFVGMIFSTIYELVCLKMDYTPNELTAAMSLYSNGRYLFTMKRNKNHIQSLYGIRALALLWLMLGYRFILPLIVPLINPVDFALDFMESFFAPVVFASQYGVDALLFANATIITFIFMSKMEKSGHFKIWKHYIFRIMRVSPFIGILIFFMMTLTPYQSSGPYYKFLTEAQIPNCEQYWWSAMLHVQNYVNPDALCVLHTFYFSIDMQLFWAAPIILFPLFYLGGWFLIFIFVVVGLTIACASTVSYFYGFQAFLINNAFPMETLQAFVRMIYFATHIRMGPWLIGVFCGYIVFRLKNTKRKINWCLSALFWILAISGIVAVIVCLYPFHQIDNIINNTTSEAANWLYIGFARNVFALCLCWFVIGCYTGTGGIINWILSLSIWQPFAKMTISIYLVSLSAQMVMIASWKTPYVFGVSEMLQAYQGDILIVFLFSCLTFLMIERPIVRSMKFILRMGQNKDESNEEIGNNEVTFNSQTPWKSFY